MPPDTVILITKQFILDFSITKKFSLSVFAAALAAAARPWIAPLG